MSVADGRAARRKMIVRYGRPHQRTVAEAVAEERRKAARQGDIKKVKKENKRG